MTVRAGQCVNCYGPLDWVKITRMVTELTRPTVLKHIDVIAPRVELAGRRVLDIGAGDGAFARQLAERGASVTGIEIESEKVARAKALSPASIEFREGVAEALPLDSGTQDIVTFIFSLHHVPLRRQAEAMREVRRVLRSPGHLVVVDPRPFGDMSEVISPVEDETGVRTITQERLDVLADGPDFALAEKYEYVHARRYVDVEQLIRDVIMVDPNRASRLPRARPAVERLFEQYGEPDGDGVVLTQPVVMYRFDTVS